MRLSSAESAAIGSSGSAAELTSSASMRSSRPPSLTRSSAATVPVIVTADSAVSADTASLSPLAGSSFANATCARPVSSRRITNCTRFWSRKACTQPHTVTRSPTCSGRSATSVRLTAGTLSERLTRGSAPLDGSQHDLDGELGGLGDLEQRDRAGAAQVVGAELERAQTLGGVAYLD